MKSQESNVSKQIRHHLRYITSRLSRRRMVPPLIHKKTCVLFQGRATFVNSQGTTSHVNTAQLRKELKKGFNIALQHQLWAETSHSFSNNRTGIRALQQNDDQTINKLPTMKTKPSIVFRFARG